MFYKDEMADDFVYTDWMILYTTRRRLCKTSDVNGDVRGSISLEDRLRSDLIKIYQK
ncbi:MAG: hypothetical protein ABII06_09305 [Pseudomonadota bacterium]